MHVHWYMHGYDSMDIDLQCYIWFVTAITCISCPSIIFIVKSVADSWIRIDAKKLTSRRTYQISSMTIKMSFLIVLGLWLSFCRLFENVNENTRILRNMMIQTQCKECAILTLKYSTDKSFNGFSYVFFIGLFFF